MVLEGLFIFAKGVSKLQRPGVVPKRKCSIWERFKTMCGLGMFQTCASKYEPVSKRHIPLCACLRHAPPNWACFKNAGNESGMF